jgi:AraC-like DNA-binding protein
VRTPAATELKLSPLARSPNWVDNGLVKTRLGLTARLIIAALIVVVALIAANVTFVVAERRANLRDELTQITQRIAREVVGEYEAYLAGIVASASNYATNNTRYRDAVLGFDGSYDARIAIYNALANLQSSYPAIVNSYVMLPSQLITFRSFTGEFAESHRFAEFELASAMVPGVSMEIVHDRTVVLLGSESVVSTLLIRPFRSIGRPDVVVIADVSVSSLHRELRERIPLLDRFSLGEGSPETLLPGVEEPGALTVSEVSSAFDRAFVVTLSDDDVVDRRQNLTFLLGSVATALVVFLLAATMLLRKLTPLERELQKLSTRPENLTALADAVRSLTEDNEQLRLRYDRVLPHYRRRVMNHLLLGLLAEGDALDERLTFTGMRLPQPPYAALCVFFAEAEQSDRESASLVLIVASAMEIEIGHEAADLLGPVDAIRYGTVIPTSSAGRLDALLTRLPPAARDRIYLGVGHSVYAPGDLAASYDTAKRALTFRRLLDGRVFDVDRIAAGVREGRAYPFELERLLIQAVQRRDAAEAEARLDELLQQVRESSYALRGLEYLRLQLLHVLEGRLAAAGASPAVLDRTVDQFPLEEANSPEAILALFRRLVSRAIEEGAGSQHGKHQVERFLQYIEDNHGRTSLQLLDLEDEFGLSRYYIGRRIKEETGEHFSDHLNRMRVERGARLLEESPEMPIREIAGLVGYSYDYYFARQFKQIYGVSPSEYRERPIQTGNDRAV